MIEDVACVILAGGKSSRMGEDKALLPFGGFDTLTEYQLNRLSKHFKRVYISCKGRSKFDFDANFIEDLDIYNDYAPMIAMASAIKKINMDYLFFISVDLPFFGYEEFYKLNKQKEDFQAVVALSTHGYEPLCAIYKRDIVYEIEHLIEQKKFKFSNLFDNILVKYIEFKDEKIFLNLNDKTQYNKALKIIKERKWLNI